MSNWTPQALHALSNAYWGSCTLHAAIRVDIFSQLFEQPQTAAQVAHACECDLRGTDLLITALAGLKLVHRRKDGLVELTDFSKHYLCRQSKEYMGYIILHQADLLESWGLLHKSVREGRPFRARSPQQEEQYREHFLLGMFNIANAQAAQSVPHIHLQGKKHLLDLGGGPSTYAMHFCKHNPTLQATVFDLPTSEPFARKVIADNALEARIQFVGGNFLHDDVPAGCDVVWISHILHGLSPEQCSALICKAVHAAAPGALVLVQEFMLDDDRNGPEFAGLFGLNMLTGCEAGQTYSMQDIATMLHNAGAIESKRLPLNLPPSCAIVQAVKP